MRKLLILFAAAVSTPALSQTFDGSDDVLRMAGDPSQSILYQVLQPDRAYAPPPVLDAHSLSAMSGAELLYHQDMARWRQRDLACRSGLQAACDAVPFGPPSAPPGVVPEDVRPASVGEVIRRMMGDDILH